jgi:hypothetical protein
MTVFISLPIATFVMSRRFAGDPAWRGWALYSLLTGIIMIASFVIFQVLGTMDQNGTIQNAPIGLEKLHCDCRWLRLDLAARNRALEKRARQNRLQAPSLTTSHWLRVRLFVCLTKWVCLCYALVAILNSTARKEETC